MLYFLSEVVQLWWQFGMRGWILKNGVAHMKDITIAKVTLRSA